MFRNLSGQKIQLFAYDSATGAPKTGDAANITAYVNKDHTSLTALNDAGATQVDATNAPGVYVWDLLQAETDAAQLTFSAKSSTSGVVIAPRFITPFPTTGLLAPATSGRTLVVDAAGLADANMVKVGPTGAGTAQTARDIGASVLLASAAVDAIWDDPVDGAYTAREMCRIIMAAMGGQASGLGTTTALYKNRDGTKTRITATVDADGNRSSVTFTDLS